MESTREQVILKIPYMQFGMLGNPRGQYEFRQALYENFSEQDNIQDRDTQAQRPELVIITNDEATRKSLARNRYNRAPDALRILQDQAQVKVLLDKAIDPELREELATAIDKFNKDLSQDQKDRIYELAKAQLQRPDGESDEKYLHTLSHEDDRALFRRAITMRRELGDILERQEGLITFLNKCIRVEIANVKEENMSLCLDGEEMITCYAFMGDIEDRQNKVQSEVGPSSLENYEPMISEDVEKHPLHDDIMKTFQNLIEKTQTRPTLGRLSGQIEQLSQKMNDDDAPPEPWR